MAMLSREDDNKEAIIFLYILLLRNVGIMQIGCIHVFAGIVAINIAQNVFVLTNKGVCYGQVIQILER